MIGITILVISALIIGAPVLYAALREMKKWLDSIHPLLPYTILLVLPFVGTILSLFGI